MKAQNFSEWAKIKEHPNLQIRYATQISRAGKSIQVELQSTISCNFSLSVSICNLQKKGANGWKRFNLAPNQKVEALFISQMACSDTLKYWFKDYKIK